MAASAGKKSAGQSSRRRGRGANQWADHYTRQAKKDRYPARSVYKLMEIQKKTPVIRRGDRVLDLGCAPGAWLLYAGELAGPAGRVIGVDLRKVAIPTPPNTFTITGDMMAEEDEMRTAIGGDFDVVLSDMAPNTTGIRDVDALRSAGLCEAALDLSGGVLRPGGNFVCKIFQGPDFDRFLWRIKQGFSRYKIFKPESTRKKSREIFIIGLDKKQEE